MRAALFGVLALSLGACAANDSPTMAIELLGPSSVDGGPLVQNVAVSLQRPFGHSFGTVTAKIDGADAGTPSLNPGADGSLREPGYAASASFYVPLTSIGRGLHVELDEDGDHFVVDVPDFNAPRAITVHTALEGLLPDGWIDIDSGVASDQLAGGFSADVDGGGLCFTQWDQKLTAGTLSLELPPAETFDDCAPVGVTNPPGSSRAVVLTFELWSVTPIATCDGPGLTCEPITAPQITRDAPATLQF